MGSRLRGNDHLPLFRGSLGRTALAQQGLDLVRGARGREEVALADTAAGLHKEHALGLGLDALRHY
jgi:hypothetical protein